MELRKKDYCKDVARELIITFIRVIVFCPICSFILHYIFRAHYIDTTLQNIAKNRGNGVELRNDYTETTPHKKNNGTPRLHRFLRRKFKGKSIDISLE